MISYKLTASTKMKLVTKYILLITHLAVSNCQHAQQDQFPFPPQFQTPSSGIMVSDSSIYLPPEPHTPVPYFAVNNMNKLPFQYLPPSGTKAPQVYPTSFSAIFSSSMRPNFDNDDDENDEVRITSPRPSIRYNDNVPPRNSSEFNQEKRDSRSLPKMFGFQQKPQSRIDGKQQSSIFQQVSTKEPPTQNSASRRMILTSEIQRNDVNDHLKSYSGSQFPQLPHLYFSSTTEPAIPILRLSNEMDLDGSFSYEALGADQTHYVQHSRMENMGTGKEEQVVEGSYSYVGDNGQTYTVHYVADSNGFRASGDHLPSPPPIPEIIQRAIQYNLAEEAKRPPHLRSSWEDDERENENNYDDKHLAVPPPRSLFTGRTPEAFSFGFSQNSNVHNTQTTSASSQIPKTNFDIALELSKSKTNSGPISPQITFSGLQGAHNPSSSSQQLSRTLPNEKSTLPQIMNYEASARGSEPENKQLWRWQYGMNANNAEQTQNKNSISRSFAEGDDVIINFNDMTPQQYSNLIKNQFVGHDEINDYEKYKNTFSTSTQNSLMTDTEFSKSKNYETGKNSYTFVLPKDETPSYKNNNEAYYKANSNEEYLRNFNNDYHDIKEDKVISSTPVNIYTPTSTYHADKSRKEEDKMHSQSRMSYPGLIRQQNFLPPSQMVTQSYDYEDTEYESKRVMPSTNYQHEINRDQTHWHQQSTNSPPNKYWHAQNERSQSTTTTPYQYSTSYNIQHYKTVQAEEKNTFRPIPITKDFSKSETTTEKSMDELIRENIFLKNIVRGKKEENNEKPQKQSEPKEEAKNVTISPNKNEKTSKYVQSFPKPQNEVKVMNKKSFDINDVLNYITMKNHLELAKTKPKTMSVVNSYQNKPSSVTFIPLNDEEKRDRNQNTEHEYSTQRVFNQHQEELQGMIKNYKVLQRPKTSSQSNNQFIDTPPRHIKAFHSDSLPPLGRAGPSMKSYLPPAYL